MSNNPSAETDSIYKTVSENENTVLSAQEELENLLHEQTKEHPTTADVYEISDMLSRIYAREIEEEDAEELAGSVIGAVVTSPTGTASNLEEYDASDELVRFMNKMVVKYQLGLLKVYNVKQQGRNFFSQIKTDLVLRSDENVAGLNHQIEISYDREFEISTSIRTNMQLINNLLEEQVRALASFDDRAVNQLDPELLDFAENQLQLIREQYSHVTEEIEDAG